MEIIKLFLSSVSLCQKPVGSFCLFPQYSYSICDWQSLLAIFGLSDIKSGASYE